MCWWKGMEDKVKFKIMAHHDWHKTPLPKKKKKIKEEDILQSVNIYHKRQERKKFRLLLQRIYIHPPIL